MFQVIIPLPFPQTASSSEITLLELGITSMAILLWGAGLVKVTAFCEEKLDNPLFGFFLYCFFTSLLLMILGLLL